MVLDNKRNCVQGWLSRVFAASLHLLAVLVLVGVALSPAFGQGTYSDSWVAGATYTGDNIDYGESNSATISVAGCGITEGSYTHTYYVDTTLTRPNGSTAYRSSGLRVGNARADVSLTWSSSDSGGFSIDSEHFARCPGDDLNFYSIGSTFFSLPLGVSFTCFEYAGTIREFIGSDGTPKRTVLYRIIVPCDASCKANTATYTFPWSYSGSAALLAAEPYVGVSPYVVCSHVAALEPIGSCNGCVDVQAP